MPLPSQVAVSIASHCELMERSQLGDVAIAGKQICHQGFQM